MSRFGWAYVNDVITGSGGSGSVPGGSDKAIQFASGSSFSGSTNFTFDYTTNTVRLTGTLYADTLIVSSSTIYKSGSTKFGDDSGDTHQFTGSIYNTTLISGTLAKFTTISGSVVSASTYYGLPTSSATVPGGANTDIQFNSGSTFSGSSNFTYNYSTSNVSLTGSLLMSGISYISEVDYIDFDVAASTPSHKNGRVFWNNTDGCLNVYNAEADITLQVGQENWTRIRNNTGTTVTNGTVVRIIGAQGDAPTIERAQSILKSGSINVDSQILGVATHDIEDSSFGYVTTQGLVRGLNTNAFADGDTLFVGTGSSGILQNTAPVAPYEIIPVGVCVKASPGTSGIIYVAVQQPLDFSDLSSVYVSGTYTYGDIWTYVSSSNIGYWKHTNTLSGSYTITGSLTATNTISSSTAQFTDLTASIGRITTVVASTLAGSGPTLIFGSAVSGSTARFTTISGSVISGSSYVNVATGAATQVQYNAGLGLLGADSNFTYSSATKALTVNGSITTTTSSFTRLQGQVTGNLNADSIVSWNNVANQFISSNVYKVGLIGTQAQISASNGLIVSGSVSITGGFKAGYIIYSSSVSIPNTSYFVGLNSTSGVLTASLLGATNYPQGQTLIFKDIGGYAGVNNILVKASGSETIDGASGVSLTANSSSVSIISNGSNGFYIVGIV